MYISDSEDGTAGTRRYMRGNLGEGPQVQSSMPAVKRKAGPWAGGYVAYKRAKPAAPRYRRKTPFVENKFVDYAVSNQSISVTLAGSESDPATPLCLNGIAQGDGESQRDGRKVVMKKVEIRGLLRGQTQADQADIPQSQAIRLVLVQDTQTSGGNSLTGAQLSAENVFIDSASSDVLVMVKPASTKRFKILADRIVPLQITAAATDGTNTNTSNFECKPFHIKKTLNIPVEYSDTGATVAEIVDNSLHLIAIASSTTTAILSYVSRVEFEG